MPTLASPKTQTLSLSTTVCYFVSHFDGLLWASHRRARNTTVTGPSYLPVQQRHLQASVVAASWLANGGLTVATPLPSTSPICPVFPSRVTACVTAYIDILPTLDGDRRTLFSDSATISISARKRLQCTMRLDRRLCLILFLALAKSWHTRSCATKVYMLSTSAGSQ